TLLAHLANKVLPTGTQELPSPITSGSSLDAVSSSSDIAKSYRACHEIARNARSNFYYAFYLLPKPRRDGLAALYAFMRLVDDVADEGDDLATKQRGLAKWRAALDEATTGHEQLFDGNAAVVPAVSSLV